MAFVFPTILTDSLEEPVMSTGARLHPEPTYGMHRRRHSSYHPRAWPQAETDNVQVLIDHFLLKLSSRLETAEAYGHQQVDASLERAYSTLTAVRDSCSRVVGDSRRRARIFVETLEELYKDVLITKETMEQKVYAGIKILEDALLEFESYQGQLLSDATCSGMTVRENLDEAWRRVDSTVHAAMETIDEGIEKIQGGIEVTIERALGRARERGLIRYVDLPKPWQVNPHILTGYRFYASPTECIWSVLTLTNELFNIWSHLIGVFVVIGLAFHFFPLIDAFSVSSTPDLFIAGIFFVAAVKCLACSTLWHTFNSIAHQHTMECLACVDYTGISMLVAASIITTEYTAFYCDPFWKVSYICVTAALGVCGTVMAWHPVFNRSELAWLRVLFFAGLAATGCIPCIHLVFIRGFAWTLNFYFPIVRSLAVYGAGAVLYAMKVPERWWPGVFDYLGASHNLWHLAVLGGIVLHYSAMIEFFTQAYENAGPACLAQLSS